MKKTYYQRHKEKMLERSRDYYSKNKNKFKKERFKIKLKIIQVYGGKCACCGETEPKFLTLEHSEGGGQKERIELKGKYDSIKLYKFLIRKNFPKGYKILCFNCNIAKGLYGECPHSQKNEKVKA